MRLLECVCRQTLLLRQGAAARADTAAALTIAAAACDTSQDEKQAVAVHKTDSVYSTTVCRHINHFAKTGS